jgi:uncharacterized membrane protein
MQEFLRSTPAQAVIWITVLLVLCAVGAYVVKRFRAAVQQREPSASELLTDFREMQEGGDISDKEFRRIKSVLKPRLHKEVESSDAEGEG